MTTHTELMVGLVGDNPASILVTARTLQPARVLLVCTARTSHLGPVLKGQLSPTPTEILTLGSADSLATTQDQVIERLGTDAPGSVLFDCTGGTKPMLLGVWQALQARFPGAVRGVYLSSDGSLREVQNGATLQADPLLKPEEFLAWNRAQKRVAAWEGMLKDVPQQSLQTRAVGEAVLKAMGERHKPRFDVRGWCQGNVRWPATLPPGFQRSGDKVTAPGDYFAKHGWLEELCLAVAHGVVGSNNTVVASRGLEVFGLSDGASTQKGLDESDVVLVRGPRLVVIEAKSRGDSAGAGEEIQKRAQKAKRFFGGLTRMIFVHPAWGLGPPGALRGMVGRDISLIGASVEQLEAAIKAALGLP